MNREYRMILILTVILHGIATYMFIYEKSQLSSFDIWVYYTSIIANSILVYLTSNDMPHGRRKKLKDIYHCFFTAYLLITPVMVDSNFGMLMYIVLVSITLGSWRLNKNGCLITAMKKTPDEPRQDHFVRKGIIKKLKLHYLVVVGGLMYVSMKLFNKNKMKGQRSVSGGGSLPNFSLTSSGKVSSDMTSISL